MDFGTAGTLRLFTTPLVGEASWLLPFALGGLIVLGIALWKKPFGAVHASLILWAGWLIGSEEKDPSVSRYRSSGLLT